MTCPPTTTTTSRPQRPSRFTEGVPLTRPDFLSRTPTSNELFLTILSEMDEMEKRKTQAQDNSSNQGNRPRGFSASSSNGSCPSPVNHTFHSTTEEARMGMGRSSLDSKNRRRASHEQEEHLEMAGKGKLGLKFKGRLRALTSGSVREEASKIAPYPGT